ncbi:14314_t:CDS:2 [Cetraspora pellucida]|uniref:14314_t:CDS:1 n=1 Tax=Cetraspora pellucida TaxID=1433469 RepID=A0A9N9D400_9GLOM|nr:14314_t:CDS:2 [Cetraspora pellucida]
MAKPPQLYFTVVRHGETSSNLNHIIQGHIDTKLNKTGREQVEIVGRRLRKLKFDHIYTSDLSRAKKTADAIAKHHPDTPFTVDMRLRERDMGRLSGKSIQDALDLIKEEEASWDDYGEPEEEFKAQVVGFFDDIIAKHLPKNEAGSSPPNKRNSHILLVTHGGVINKLVKEHLIMDLGFFVNDYLSMKHKAKNTSVTKFVVRRVESSNSTTDDDDATSIVSSNTTENESNDGDSEKISHRDIERKIRLKGDVTLWSCVSHLAAQGKRTHGDSQIDDYVH